MGHFNWLGQLMSFFYDPVGDRLILFSGATDLGKAAPKAGCSINVR